MLSNIRNRLDSFLYWAGNTIKDYSYERENKERRDLVMYLTGGQQRDSSDFEIFRLVTYDILERLLPKKYLSGERS